LTTPPQQRYHGRDHQFTPTKFRGDNMRSFLHAAFAFALAPLAAVSAAQAQQPVPPPPTNLDPSVYMATYIEVAPAAAGQAVTALKQLMEASRKEAGVLNYDVVQQVSPTNHFLILGAWKDQAAFDAHEAAAYTKEAQTKLTPQLLAPPDMRTGSQMVSPAFKAPTAGAIYVGTHVDVAPPARDNAAAALVKYDEAARAASGNERAYSLREKQRLNHFTIVEIWRDQAANDAFEGTPAFKELRTAIAPAIGALFDRRFYKAL
jgi:quinol monooxygenase YgiN